MSKLLGCGIKLNTQSAGVPTPIPPRSQHANAKTPVFISNGLQQSFEKAGTSESTFLKDLHQAVLDPADRLARAPCDDNAMNLDMQGNTPSTISKFLKGVL